MQTLHAHDIQSNSTPFILNSALMDLLYSNNLDNLETPATEIHDFGKIGSCRLRFLQCLKIILLFELSDI